MNSIVVLSIVWISQLTWASPDTSTVLLLTSRHEPAHRLDPAVTEVQTAWNALLCTKASLRCVGWPRQDERGAPLSPAALCNTERNLTATSRPKSLPSKTHFKCCHSLLAGTSFLWQKEVKEPRKCHSIQFPVSDFMLENRTWVPRYTWWINTEKRGPAVNKWYKAAL